jgi:hypothetical protein
MIKFQIKWRYECMYIFLFGRENEIDGRWCRRSRRIGTCRCRRVIWGRSCPLWPCRRTRQHVAPPGWCGGGFADRQIRGCDVLSQDWMREFTDWEVDRQRSRWGLTLNLVQICSRIRADTYSIDSFHFLVFIIHFIILFIQKIISAFTIRRMVT